jgi:hypothetical protein
MSDLVAVKLVDRRDGHIQRDLPVAERTGTVEQPGLEQVLATGFGRSIDVDLGLEDRRQTGDVPHQMHIAERFLQTLIDLQNG